MGKNIYSEYYSGIPSFGTPHAKSFDETYGYKDLLASIDQEILKELSGNTMKIKTISPKKPATILTEAECLKKLNAVCSGGKGGAQVAALAGLIASGWTVSMSDGIDFEGRKGIVIAMTEPVATKETGSVPSMVPGDNGHLPRTP